MTLLPLDGVNGSAGGLAGASGGVVLILLSCPDGRCVCCGWGPFGVCVALVA